VRGKGWAWPGFLGATGAEPMEFSVLLAEAAFFLGNPFTPVFAGDFKVWELDTVRLVQVVLE
jgi:hypothetical protein